MQGFGSDLMMAAASITGTLPGNSLPKVEGAHVVATVHDEICTRSRRTAGKRSVECSAAWRTHLPAPAPDGRPGSWPVQFGRYPLGVHDLHDDDLLRRSRHTPQNLKTNTLETLEQKPYSRIC